MSTQTALGQSYPTPCKRCGGALYRQVDDCPYCGAADPLDAGPHARSVIPGGRANAKKPTPQRLDARPARAETSSSTAFAVPHAQTNGAEVALRRSLVSQEMSAPALDEPPYGMRGNRLTIRRLSFAILAIVLIGLAYVAYTLFSDNTDTSDPDESSVDQTASVTNQDARTTTGTIAPFAPGQTAHSSGTAKAAVPDTSIAMVNPAKTTPAALPVPAVPLAPVAPVALAAAVPPPVAVAPVKPTPLPFHDASQALQAAHLAFNAKDLSRAQAALASAQALQPGNADAQSISTDLRPLTTRRDTALQAAQTCVSQQSWACARQHANEALSLDTGNEAAKAILQRVIRETGWAPLKTDAATGAQSNLSAPTPGAAALQQAQVQTPLPKSMQANGNAVAVAPRANAGGTAATIGSTRPAATDPNSVDARERSIVDSGWSQGPANGTKTAATSSGQ